MQLTVTLKIKKAPRWVPVAIVKHGASMLAIIAFLVITGFNFGYPGLKDGNKLPGDIGGQPEGLTYLGFIVLLIIGCQVMQAQHHGVVAIDGADIPSDEGMSLNNITIFFHHNPFYSCLKTTASEVHA